MSKRGLFLLLCAGVFAIAGARANAENKAVTLNSLLEEMINTESVARWPQPEFTCKQASSYDRSRIAPDKPGWFANNDQSQFIRDEDHAGRRERVMMDADGPGALVRFWVTADGRRAGALRVYLDGDDAPALTFSSYDLMPNAKEFQLTEHPLLHPHTSYKLNGGGGSTLYLPIPYARHCKVTWEEAHPKDAGPRYYQLDYRTYPAGTRVETFSQSALDASQDTLQRVGQALLQPPTPEGKIVPFQATIAGGEQTSLNLSSGSSAIRQLEMQFTTDNAADLEQTLRSAVLQMDFDGETTVWCPVSDFAGSGVGLRELHSWYRDVSRDGKITCRWVMPYAKSARITLINAGTKPLRAQMTATVGRWKWDARSMHFHANWRHQADVATRPDQDWNFLTTAGKGVLVGDVLAVFNPIPAWYGEGDEKIWVDGEAFPSTLGTGTEDYYNASWAPTPVYQTPFANGPRVDEARSKGYNTYTRTRNLDIIPFQSKLQFDMEIEHWQETKVNVAATTYWYARPGATHNRAPLWEEVKRTLAQVPLPFRIAHAVECETLQILHRTPGLVTETQDTDTFPGQWSGNQQLLGRAQQSGDYIELAIPATGRQHLTLYAAKAGDYGILRFAVNGQTLPQEFDGYNPQVMPSGPIDLGDWDAQDGKLRLRVQVTGANAKAGGAKYLFGLDCVVVEPVNK